MLPDKYSVALSLKFHNGGTLTFYICTTRLYMDSPNGMISCTKSMSIVEPRNVISAGGMKSIILLKSRSAAVLV